MPTEDVSNIAGSGLGSAFQHKTFSPAQRAHSLINLPCCLRNSVTIRLNSAGFSSWGICPLSSISTLREPGIVSASRSASAASLLFS